jgi:hypothetical protein
MKSFTALAKRYVTLPVESQLTLRLRVAIIEGCALKAWWGFY